MCLSILNLKRKIIKVHLCIWLLKGSSGKRWICTRNIRILKIPKLLILKSLTLCLAKINKSMRIMIISHWLINRKEKRINVKLKKNHIEINVKASDYKIKLIMYFWNSIKLTVLWNCLLLNLKSWLMSKCKGWEEQQCCTTEKCKKWRQLKAVYGRKIIIVHSQKLQKLNILKL